MNNSKFLSMQKSTFIKNDTKYSANINFGFLIINNETAFYKKIDRREIIGIYTA